MLQPEDTYLIKKNGKFCPSCGKYGLRVTGKMAKSQSFVAQCGSGNYFDRTFSGRNCVHTTNSIDS